MLAYIDPTYPLWAGFGTSSTFWAEYSTSPYHDLLPLVGMRVGGNKYIHDSSKGISAKWNSIDFVQDLKYISFENNRFAKRLRRLYRIRISYKNSLIRNPLIWQQYWLTTLIYSNLAYRLNRLLHLREMFKCLMYKLVGWILWHIKLCRLFNVKSCFYINMWFVNN